MTIGREAFTFILNKFLNMSIVDSITGTPAEVNDGALVVVDKTPDTNELETITNNVGTTAVEIEFPEENEFIIYHQTEDGIVHFSSSESVSTSDPKLGEGDVIRITGREDFLIYMISASGTVPVFVTSAIKG